MKYCTQFGKVITDEILFSRSFLLLLNKAIKYLFQISSTAIYNCFFRYSNNKRYK